MTIALSKSDFSAALLEWYDRSRIEMSWRGSRDPYRICLSEVMLQQTRVATVGKYYERFLETFPTIEALAAAPLSDVLKCWEGLGYYTRARNLHRLARLIVNEHAGKFPTSDESLEQLPGIGRYTAAAIASIAFDRPIAVLDGNVIRILSRLTDLVDDVTEQPVQKLLQQLATSLLPSERPGDYNQALMDLGRTVCKPHRPVCDICPVQGFCLAYERGTSEQRPVKKLKAPLPRVRAVAAVIRDENDRLLLIQRPPAGLLGGMWALPGGMCRPEESLADCLRRSLRRDLGIEVDIAGEMAVAKQEFSHFRMTLRAYGCHLTTGQPQAAGVADLAWISLDEAGRYGLGKADRKIVDSLECWQPRLFEEL